MAEPVRLPPLWLLALAITICVLMLPPPWVEASSLTRGTVVRVGYDHTIASGHQHSGNIMVFGGNIVVNGELRGRATAIGGTVRVEGEVQGDVTALGGKVILLDGAKVVGSINSFGGGIERDAGSELRGEVNSVVLAQGLHVPQFTLAPFQWRSIPVYSLYLIGLYLSVLLVGYLFPEPIRSLDSVLCSHPGRSLLVGALALIAMGPLTILMALSVVGLPLVLFLWLGFFAAKLLGYAITARVSGRWLLERIGLPAKCALNPAVGVLSLGLLRTIPIAGVLSGIVVLVIGLGAVIMGRFGFGGSWPSFRLRRTED